MAFAAILVVGITTHVGANFEKTSPLIVVHSNNTPPLSYLGLNHEPKGLVIDFWHAWSEVNGIPIKFVLTDWPGTLKMIREGKADIHGGLYYNDDRADFLDYAPAYFDMDAALFVRKSSLIKSVDDVGSHPVAVLDQGFSEFYLRKNYPEMILKPYKTSKHMAQAAVDGEVDALLTEYTTLIHQLGAQAQTDKFKPIATLYKHSLRPAVRKGNTELLEVVEDGMANMSSDRLEHVFSRWTIAKPGRSGWFVFGVGLGGAAVVIMGLFLFLSRRGTSGRG